MQTTLEHRGDQMRIHHHIEWSGDVTVAFIHREGDYQGAPSELREWHVSGWDLTHGRLNRTDFLDTEKRPVDVHIVARAVSLACRTQMKRELTKFMENGL